MNRRTFLKVTGVTVGTILLPCNTNHADTTKSGWIRNCLPKHGQMIAVRPQAKKADICWVGEFIDLKNFPSSVQSYHRMYCPGSNDGIWIKLHINPITKKTYNLPNYFWGFFSEEISPNTEWKPLTRLEERSPTEQELEVGVYYWNTNDWTWWMGYKKNTTNNGHEDRILMHRVLKQTPDRDRICSSDCTYWWTE